MLRIVCSSLLLMLLAVACTDAGPVDGSFSKKYRMRPKGAESATVELTFKFQGGRRAFVVAQGDHKPSVPLELTVYDADDKVVGRDESGTDFLAVFWVPARTASYRIVLRNLGDKHYDNYKEEHKYTDVYLVAR
jgi:hypothetical protein